MVLERIPKSSNSEFKGDEREQSVRVAFRLVVGYSGKYSRRWRIARVEC